MDSDFRYDAFISYSHRDMGWGRWLQRRLETFRVPRASRAACVGGQNLRIFRDQTDLAGLELQETLQKELRAAKALIVICSPASAASRWVNEEVRTFQALAGNRPVIPFIVEGEPDSESPELECYPPALRSAGEKYYLGANVREIGKNKALLKVISLLIDVRFNRLVDREKQRKRRNGLIVGTALTIAAVSAGVLLWKNAVITRENHELAQNAYMISLVMEASEKDLSPETFSMLVTSAEAGNTDAMIYLADAYLKGWGTETDEAAAFDWYLRAANAGAPLGMVGAANCLLDGTGTEINQEEAFAWNLRAAEAGAPDGMLNTAICYETGNGTETNPEQAFLWYKRSAEAGLELGMYNVAQCYRTGLGTEPDNGQAFYWMQRLAETGNPFGMYNLALMYQYGFGTEIDPRQAYLWYCKVADTGDPDGMYMVGWCTENHFGTEDAAVEWYLKAAALGHAEAQEALARLSEAGTEE